MHVSAAIADKAVGAPVEPFEVEKGESRSMQLGHSRVERAVAAVLALQLNTGDVPLLRFVAHSSRRLWRSNAQVQLQADQKIARAARFRKPLGSCNATLDVRIAM